MKKGKLFVIEGTDGSGKQTQTELLAKKLKEENYEFMQVSFPCYESPSSSLVKMYLAGEFGQNVNDVSAYAASSFYALDRYAQYKKDFGKYYENGGIVLADRYTTSNMIHQASKIEDETEKKEFLNWLNSLDVKVIGLNEEDSEIKKITSKDLKIMELFDVFIQSNPIEYLNCKKLGMSNNIYIPNINCFNQIDNLKSNLNNHNIIMFGKLNDKNNDIVSVITAMTLIIKEFSDTKLNIITSDKPSQEVTKLIKVFKLASNIDFSEVNPITYNSFSKASISVFTSLTDEYSPIINMAKSLGIPCIISSDETNSTTFKDGVIKIDMSNYEELSNEIIKLLKNNKYKKDQGEQAKLSYNSFKENALGSWTKLLGSLKSNKKKDIQNIKTEIESFFWNSKKETKKVVSIAKATIEEKEKPTQKIEKSKPETKEMKIKDVEAKIVKDSKTNEIKPKEIANIKENKVAKQNITTIQKVEAKEVKLTKENKSITDNKPKENKVINQSKPKENQNFKEKTTTKVNKVITENKPKEIPTIKEKTTTKEKVTTKENKVINENKPKEIVTTKEKTTTKETKITPESKPKENKIVEKKIIKQKIPEDKTIKVNKNTAKVETVQDKEKKDIKKSHKSKKKHSSHHKKKDKKKN